MQLVARHEYLDFFRDRAEIEHPNQLPLQVVHLDLFLGRIEDDHDGNVRMFRTDAFFR